MGTVDIYLRLTLFKFAADYFTRWLLPSVYPSLLELLARANRRAGMAGGAVGYGTGAAVNALKATATMFGGVFAGSALGAPPVPNPWAKSYIVEDIR